jgi:hypothetical protein
MFEQTEKIGLIDPAITKQAVDQIVSTRHLSIALKSFLPCIEEIETGLGGTHA